jgi:hypothetical protein
VPVLILVVAILISMALGTDKGEDPEMTVEVRRVAGHAVVIIRDFLPFALAVRWRAELLRLWDAKADAGAEEARWQFTTNNAGSLEEGWRNNLNRKHRGLDNVEARTKTALKLFAKGMFSYSKWELDPRSALVKEMADHFLLPQTRATMARALNRTSDTFSGKELSDLFVTHYDQDNFLSDHDDGVSGSVAFVLSLAAGPQWEKSFGGQLDFRCKAKPSQRGKGPPKVCESLGPDFNNLVVFATWPIGPTHRVAAVTAAAAERGWQRFGLTGWFSPPLFLPSALYGTSLCHTKAYGNTRKHTATHGNTRKHTETHNDIGTHWHIMSPLPAGTSTPRTA